MQTAGLVTDRARGLTYQQLANRYGIHRNSVPRILARAFEEPKPKPVKPPGPRAVLQPCGTPAARVRHLSYGQKPCEKCRLAWNEYNRAQRVRQWTLGVKTRRT